MGTRGPARSCECEDIVSCKICRKREQQRRYANGLVPLPHLPRRRFRESRLHLPKDPVELAYLAGLFDGEGCITKYASNQNWVAQIGMTDKPIMDELAKLGGSIRQETARGMGRKPLMRWRVLAQIEVLEFLNALLPYLRVKRPLAEVVIAELESIPEGRIRKAA